MLHFILFMLISQVWWCSYCLISMLFLRLMLSSVVAAAADVAADVVVAAAAACLFL